MAPDSPSPLHQGTNYLHYSNSFIQSYQNVDSNSCLKATEKPHELIVFEDLKTSGYKMADRFEKLDLNHGLLTLSKLAKFHAAAACKEKVGP